MRLIAAMRRDRQSYHSKYKRHEGAIRLVWCLMPIAGMQVLLAPRCDHQMQIVVKLINQGRLDDRGGTLELMRTRSTLA